MKTLADRVLLRGFKAIDGMIRKNQPVFMLDWLGSASFLIATTVLGFWVLDDENRVLLVAMVTLYLPSVHVSIVVINVPLNKRLQAQSQSELGDDGIARAREAAEDAEFAGNSCSPNYDRDDDPPPLLVNLSIAGSCRIGDSWRNIRAAPSSSCASLGNRGILFQSF